MNNINNNFISIAKHIGIIMDGNRRWAKLNGLKSIDGHKKGAANVKKIIKTAIQCKIEYLTLFAFSSENWKRKNKEVQDLLGLLRYFLKNQIKDLLEQDISIKVLGDLSLFPKDIIENLNQLIKNTKNKNRIQLIIAMNYGARQEITSGVKKIVEEVVSNKISINDINEQKISNSLYTSKIPDPDLIIRTGGDCRLSNFLLWQSAYSELIFVKKTWPEFSKEDFLDALSEFNKRERRFGGF